jgi:hypothetical protein
MRIAAKDRGQEHPAAAAHVDEALEGAEVIGRHDGARLLLRPARHRGLQRRLFGRVGVEVGEGSCVVTNPSIRARSFHCGSIPRIISPGGRPVQTGRRNGTSSTASWSTA